MLIELLAGKPSESMGQRKRGKNIIIIYDTADISTLISTTHHRELAVKEGNKRMAIIVAIEL